MHREQFPFQLVLMEVSVRGLCSRGCVGPYFSSVRPSGFSFLIVNYETVVSILVHIVGLYL